MDEEMAMQLWGVASSKMTQHPFSVRDTLLPANRTSIIWQAELIL
jgi:hypothetical protein